MIFRKEATNPKSYFWILNVTLLNSQIFEQPEHTFRVSSRKAHLLNHRCPKTKNDSDHRLTHRNHRLENVVVVGEKSLQEDLQQTSRWTFSSYVDRLCSVWLLLIKCLAQDAATEAREEIEEQKKRKRTRRSRKRTKEETDESPDPRPKKRMRVTETNKPDATATQMDDEDSHADDEADESSDEKDSEESGDESVDDRSPDYEKNRWYPYPNTLRKVKKIAGMSHKLDEYWKVQNPNVFRFLPQFFFCVRLTRRRATK